MKLNAQQISPTRYEKTNGNESGTYEEVITWWKKLAQQSPSVHLQEKGLTDAGIPLHLITVSNEGGADFASFRKKGKSIILINNGIHPGEPDGIDATMLLVKDIVLKKIKLPANIVLAIIPVYNIGGMLDRSEFYRVDQNGPAAFGFRGNAQNLDLNRDFIKADSRNALAFTEIFHLTDPDVFIDNHVSNGADYQHIMTLLTSQHNKLGGDMGIFMNSKFEPALYQNMAIRGFDLIPYVNVWGNTPDKGWTEFFDSPRYASGYATLWHTFAFVPETHMLKPYPQRVAATKALMESFIDFTTLHIQEIQQLRKDARTKALSQPSFPLSWTHDKSFSQPFTYKGYKSILKPSEVSGLDRLYYDRSQPYTLEIPIYNKYVAEEHVSAPKAYIIPQGWWKVIDRLKANHIIMESLKKDTVIEVEVYHINSYQAAQRPYEGHHNNSQVKTTSSIQKINFRKGDIIIPFNQKGNRFLIETLEPTAMDSYFAWNFFDAILGQKEGYAAYNFEDIAAQYLKEKPTARKALEEKVKTDSSFAKSASAQLSFVYQQSPWMEKAFNRYPVYRLLR